MQSATLPAFRAEADPVALVPFAAAHLPGALALSQEMSWPYRLEDWDFALRVGRGFALEHDGAVIGTAAMFPDEGACATVGMIIVSGAAQGRGYGKRLLEALLGAPARAPSCSTRPRRAAGSTSATASRPSAPCRSTRARSGAPGRPGPMPMATSA